MAYTSAFHMPVKLIDGEYQFDFDREPWAFQLTASSTAGLFRFEPTWLAKMREAREWLEGRKSRVDDWFA